MARVKGGGKTLHDEAAHGQLTVDRFPEVALQGAPQPVEILHQDRAVEAQFLFQDETDLFVEDLVRRHHHFDRSARQEAKDEENEGSQQEQDGNKVQQAPHGVSQHGVSPRTARGFAGRRAPFYTKLQVRQQQEAGKSRGCRDRRVFNWCGCHNRKKPFRLIANYCPRRPHDGTVGNVFDGQEMADFGNGDAGNLCVGHRPDHCQRCHAPNDGYVRGDAGRHHLGGSRVQHCRDRHGDHGLVVHQAARAQAGSTCIAWACSRSPLCSAAWHAPWR